MTDPAVHWVVPGPQTPSSPVLQDWPPRLLASTHWPAPLHSSTVQRSASASHVVPWAFGLGSQAPVVRLQVSAKEHWVSGGQETGVSMQLPLWHSPEVQRSPSSSHGVRSSLFTSRHSPT